MPSEQELVEKLNQAERDYTEAKRKLTDAKKAWNDAETVAVGAKITKERVTEELRVFRNQKVIPGEEYFLYDDEDSRR